MTKIDKMIDAIKTPDEFAAAVLADAVAKFAKKYGRPDAFDLAVPSDDWIMELAKIQRKFIKANKRSK